MSKWLYNSNGDPIVFISNGRVFSKSGKYIGKLENNEVWHGEYKGEIYKDDRFVYKTDKGDVMRGTPGTPGTPGIPGIAGNKGAIRLPRNYRDVELDNK